MEKILKITDYISYYENFFYLYFNKINEKDCITYNCNFFLIFNVKLSIYLLYICNRFEVKILLYNIIEYTLYIFIT